MAEGLSRSLEEQVTCSICLERFQDPRLLPCLHTFCKDCLEKVLDKSTRQHSIQCPECRAIVKIKNNIATDLKVNFWVNRNLALLELPKDENPSGKKEVFMCNSCDNKKQAKATCFECETLLCDACVKAHQQMAVLKDHQVLNLDEMKDRVKPLPSNLEKPTLCEKHKGKMQKFYCEKCNLMICKDCNDIDHKKHKALPIGDIIAKHKEKLQEQLGAVGRTTDKIDSALYKVRDMLEKVRKNAQTIEKNVDKEIDSKIKSLNEMRHSLKEEARKMTTSKIMRLSAQQHGLETHMASLKSSIELTKNVLEKGGGHDVFSMGKQVSSRLSDLTTKDIDGEVDDEAKLVLQTQKKQGVKNMMKIIDKTGPDHEMCNLSWAKKKSISLSVKNHQKDSITIKLNRIQICCPFECRCKKNPEAQNYVIEGPFQRPPDDPFAKNIHSMEVWIDGRPIKDSPITVQYDNSIWKKVKQSFKLRR